MNLENVEDIYPLSPTQEGMLFHSLESTKAALYFEQCVLEFHGELDCVRLESAARRLVEGHPALRTSILWEGLERPVQVVRARVEVEWTVHDLVSLGSPTPGEALEGILRADRERSFDLTRAPLARFALVRQGAVHHRLVFSFHHIVLDGWSTRILLQELASLYRDFVEQQECQSPERTPFRAYIDWLEARDPESSRAYWVERLAGLAAPTPFATPDAAPELSADESRSERSRSIPPELTTRLARSARDLRITMSTLVQAAWALVVSAYSQERDVVFGATMAGRPHEIPGVEGSVGLFIETVPLRVRVPPEETVRDWLSSLQREQLDLMEHAHASLSRIQSWSEVPAGVSLFETLLVFESMPASSSDSGFDELQVDEPQFIERSNYPLALLVVPGEGLRLIAIHDQRRFSIALVDRVLDSLVATLERLAASPDSRVGDIETLGGGERAKLLDDWGVGAELVPRHASWPALLADVVLRKPDAIAIECAGERISYGELQSRARRLARYLRAQGVESGDLVGVRAERTPSVLVSILAVLEAGAAYVPLDPAYPRARLAQIASDAQLKLIVASGGSLELGENEVVAARQLDTDLERDAIARYEGSDLSLDIDRESLAYAIYTSGSTGTPRGVLVSHGNLLHSTEARLRGYDRPVGKFLLLSSLSFDSSVAGVFWTLASGGTLVLPDAGRHEEIEHLLEVAVRARVSHLLAVPALYRLLLERADGRLRDLRVAIVAGEACPSDLIVHHERVVPEAELHNEYGPTEASVWCTVHRVRAEDANGSVPIGRPIAGCTVRVVDARLRLVPLGVPGELLVGGGGVARGYRGRDEETRARFLDDPFTTEKAARVYRTGDLVRWTERGELVFIGRDDGQVKIRGRRIELAEIERALLAQPSVHEAVVVARPISRPGSVRSVLDGRPESLVAALAAIEESVAEDVLAGLERLTAQEAAAAWKVESRARLDAIPVERARAGEPTHPRSSTASNIHVHEGNGYAFSLRIDDPNFLSPPNENQRRWLVRQALRDIACDLERLSEEASRFVPGSASFLETAGDVSDQDLVEDEILEDWQGPLLRAMADLVTESHGHVLEIGFGRGISATMIQELGVEAHTIIEANEHCIRRYFEPWRARWRDRDIRLVHSTWQEAALDLGPFDGVFFHTAARNLEELIATTVNQTTYAEHFFSTASSLLRSGGVFTYLANEIDSLGREHQRLLLEHFSSFRVRRIDDLQIPEDTRDVWWARSMVVVAAVR